MGKLSPKASFSEIHDKLGTTLWSCWSILRKINTFSDAIYIPNHSLHHMEGMQQHATWEELYDGHTVNQIHRQVRNRLSTIRGMGDQIYGGMEGWFASR